MKLFIIIYDDGDCIQSPMHWDADCEGALCGVGDQIALFMTRKAARQAIAISAAFARLQVAKGQPANDDFLSARKNLKILPVTTTPPTE